MRIFHIMQVNGQVTQVNITTMQLLYQLKHAQ